MGQERRDYPEPENAANLNFFKDLPQGFGDWHGCVAQKGLAELIGTRQSNISRLESGNYNPSLELLTKIAQVMGKRLEVRIV
jgi:transcriptional regulator with XRE-family HTH domain